MLDKWTTKKKWKLTDEDLKRLERVTSFPSLGIHFDSTVNLWSWSVVKRWYHCGWDAIKRCFYIESSFWSTDVFKHNSSVVQNTHVTWSRLTEVLVHFTSVSVGGVAAAYRHRETDRCVSSIYSYQQRESSTWCCQLIKYLSKNSAFKVKIKKS